MLLIQRLPQQSLNNSLSANIELSCFLIKLMQHGKCKVHIDALNRRHHLALPGEKARDVLASVGHVRDLIGGGRLWELKFFWHGVALIHGHTFKDIC
jgi:hypothetical protein